MVRKRYTDERIIGVLKEAEAGAKPNRRGDRGLNPGRTPRPVSRLEFSRRGSGGWNSEPTGDGGESNSA